MESNHIDKHFITDAPKIIVAIDGFSSSGKSTMARELAKRINYIYIDSGAMYRAVALYALRHNMIFEDGSVDKASLIPHLNKLTITFDKNRGEDGIQHTLLNGEDVEKEIRGMEVSTHVSSIAEIAEVRERMVELQQQFGIHKGVVMDGRDIGTTVFPHAELKVFVNASAHERARRRWRELQQKGVDINFEDILKNVEARDKLDTTREVSPLRKAPDAWELDNGAYTHEEQMEWLLKHFQLTLEQIENEGRD